MSTPGERFGAALRRSVPWLLAALAWLALPASLRAQAVSTVTCGSPDGARQHCAADTSAGVTLARATSDQACLLGKTWGYDDRGIWVIGGCSGEFVVSPKNTVLADVSDPTSVLSGQGPDTHAYEPIETWSQFEPGKGFLIGRTRFGEVSISAYVLVRYVNQLPPEQMFADHLGREHEIQARNDIYSHRVMVFLKGWLGLPKFRYQIILWTVNTTDQKALFGNLGYQFHPAFSLYAGMNALPGTRSLQGSHPYWLAPDRVMADEFFRPFFTNGVWATGEVVSGLWYNLMVGNNLSALGITANQLTRDLAYAGSVWWMPTTKEFGPQGAYGDWEQHSQLATRFGASSTHSREDRFSDLATGSPDNTTLRLADSLNLFELGALAPDVTVQRADVTSLAVDAGLKYRGFFLQAEYYNRWLNKFDADGPLPVNRLHDTGFYVQAAFFPVPRKLELYAATSQIFGDKQAGFRNSYEVLGGLNYYFADTRNIRLHAQGIYVNRSPVSSTFGYYVGGLDGAVLSAAVSAFF
jgi:hypothetical protein